MPDTWGTRTHSCPHRCGAHGESRTPAVSLESRHQTAQPEITVVPARPVRARRTRWSSSSSAPTTAGLSDADVAWMLADAADLCLTGHERTMAFVELGCGDHHLAIERILDAVLSSHMTLPVATFDRLTRWLDGYAGSPEEPRLRTMLARIRAQQFTPIPSHTHDADSDAAWRAAASA